MKAPTRTGRVRSRHPPPPSAEPRSERPLRASHSEGAAAGPGMGAAGHRGHLAHRTTSIIRSLECFRMLFARAARELPSDDPMRPRLDAASGNIGQLVRVLTDYVALRDWHGTSRGPLPPSGDGPATR